MWWSYRTWNCKKAKISHRFIFFREDAHFLNKRYLLSSSIICFFSFFGVFVFFAFFESRSFFDFRTFFNFVVSELFETVKSSDFSASTIDLAFFTFFGLLVRRFGAGNFAFYGIIIFWKKSRARNFFCSSKIWKRRRLNFFLLIEGTDMIHVTWR